MTRFDVALLLKPSSARAYPLRIVWKSSFSLRSSIYATKQL